MERNYEVPDRNSFFHSLWARQKKDMAPQRILHCKRKRNVHVHLIQPHSFLPAKRFWKDGLQGTQGKVEGSSDDIVQCLEMTSCRQPHRRKRMGCTCSQCPPNSSSCNVCFGYNSIFPTKATLPSPLASPLTLSDLVLLKQQSLAAASALLLPVLRANPPSHLGTSFQQPFNLPFPHTLFSLPVERHLQPLQNHGSQFVPLVRAFQHIEWSKYLNIYDIGSMENIKNHFLPADCKRGNMHSSRSPARLQNCWPNHIALCKEPLPPPSVRLQVALTVNKDVLGRGLLLD